TITGEHEYVIRYRVEGALNGFEGHDELYWNATGNDWSVPIERARVTVTLPVAIQDVLCFAGPPGSTRQCDEAMQRADTATFAHAALVPGEGVTVVAGFPSGVVPPPAPILEERWSLARAFSVTPVTAGATGALALLVLGGA